MKPEDIILWTIACAAAGTLLGLLIGWILDQLDP